MRRDGFRKIEVRLFDGKTAAEFGIRQEPAYMRRSDQYAVVYRDDVI